MIIANMWTIALTSQGGESRSISPRSNERWLVDCRAGAQLEPERGRETAAAPAAPAGGRCSEFDHG